MTIAALSYPSPLYSGERLGEGRIFVFQKKGTAPHLTSPLSTGQRDKRLVLIAVGLLGRVWLYVRGLVPSSFISKPEESATLRLRNEVQSSIAAYDQKKHTPVERVIFRK